MNLTLAQSQQDQVLQAINDSVGAKVDGTLVLFAFVIIVLLLIALAIYQKTNKKEPVAVTKKVFRNPRRLTREVAEDMRMSPAELRKLEHHAERIGVDHPLTLMLCPSLLKKQKSSVPAKKA